MRAIQRIALVDPARNARLEFQRIVQVERLPAAERPFTVDGLGGGVTSTVDGVVERDGYLPIVNLSALTVDSLPSHIREDPVRHMAGGHWSPGFAEVEDMSEAPDHAEPRS